MINLRVVSEILAVLIFTVCAVGASSASADASVCAKEDARVCLAIENLPSLKVGDAISFDVEASIPLDGLKVEMIWDSAAEDLRIVSAPKKLARLGPGKFFVEKVILVLDGDWVIAVEAEADQKRYSFELPVVVTN